MTATSTAAESIEAKRQRLREILRQRAAQSKRYPLSFPQQRLWFLWQLQPESSAYNCPGAIRLTGSLDVAALRASLGEVVRRHEMLRTTFPLVDGEPVQSVTPSLEVALPIVDLSGARDREKLALTVADQQAHRPFDLTRGPLLRTLLLRLSPDEHLMVLIVHHIISDGQSFAILIQELTTLYCACVEGRASPLRELPLQYGNFAQWQHAWLNAQAFAEQMDYWRQQLKNMPTLVLPGSGRSRNDGRRYGEQRWFLFPAELSYRLKSLANKSNVTLFMTLLAGLQTLLYRYTGQSEFAIGSPIANRRHTETEGLIGFFVNMLVLRADLSGNPSFRDLLKRVRETCLEAYAHQDVPFEKIVKELASGRSARSTPLLSVVFALENAPRKAINLPGLSTGRSAMLHGCARFDLTVLLVDMPDGLEVTVDFDRELFTISEMDMLVRRFETLLKAAVDNPELRLLDIPLTINSAETLTPIQADDFDFQFDI